MKTKRILITLSLRVGLNEMGFESSLTRQQILIDNPKLNLLTIREFCMMTKEELLLEDNMTEDKLSAIERLLMEYSLRLGMSDAELEEYLNQYYLEHPIEKEVYDMCNQIRATPPNMYVFDENKYREDLYRELHSSPMGGNRLNDLGWQRYHSVREAYLGQPWYVKCFCSRLARMKRAFKDAFVIHELFCQLSTEDSIDAERWYFEHKEVKSTL